jgi:hypothetical protein
MTGWPSKRKIIFHYFYFPLFSIFWLTFQRSGVMMNKMANGVIPRSALQMSAVKVWFRSQDLIVVRQSQNVLAISSRVWFHNEIGCRRQSA